MSDSSPGFNQARGGVEAVPVDTQLLQLVRFARKQYQEHLDKTRCLALTQEKAASRKRKINEEIRIFDEEKKI